MAGGNTEERPARAGDRLAATAVAVFAVSRICAPFVAEGGALIVDGEGTLITTESCLLNPNRNPFWTKCIQKQKVEQAFERYGISRLIWLKGDASELITSGHIDGYALFTAPGALLVETMEDGEWEAPGWRERDIALLENSMDTAGRSLKIERVTVAQRVRLVEHMAARFEAFRKRPCRSRCRRRLFRTARHHASALAYGIVGAAADQDRRHRTRQQDGADGLGHDGQGRA